MRISFEKENQRKFLKEVIKKTASPSLRSLSQFGIKTPYSTLKNYYTEKRLIPLKLFEDLCSISGIKKEEYKINLIPENWGKIKGGKIKKKA